VSWKTLAEGLRQCPALECLILRKVDINGKICNIAAAMKSLRELEINTVKVPKNLKSKISLHDTIFQMPFFL
jgi:hypothetical protein